MLVVSSQGWSGSDTCDGQMIQNLNKIQSSIDNIWERKPKPTDGYLFLFSKVQSHRIYTDNFFIVVLEFHPMWQSWIITLYQTRSIFPIFPVCESGWNGSRTTATIYTTLEWTGLKPRYTTSKFLYIIHVFVFLRKPIELIWLGGKYIFRIIANFSRVNVKLSRINA